MEIILHVAVTDISKTHLQCTLRRKLHTIIDPFKSSVLFMGRRPNVAEPDQTPQNAASDQVHYCLLTVHSIKIGIKMKNTAQQPLKREWTVPIDNSGKFHEA